MFGKYFASTFTGSMYGAGAEIHAVWAFIIANANDATGYIELNAQVVGGCIGMSPAAVDKVIAKFCSPDLKSRSKVKEGRKLLKEGEYLYQIVNYEKYRAIRNEAARRESNREAQRRRREKLKKTPGIMDKGTKHEQENIKKWADGEQPEPMP